MKVNLWHRYTWMIICAAVLLMVMPARGTAQAQEGQYTPSTVSGTIHPPDDSEGIILNYTISGGSVTEETEEDGSRHYVRGTVRPGDTVSMSVTGNGTTFSSWHHVNEDKEATLSVWLDGGGDENRKTVILAPGASGSLTASFVVPDDAREFELVGYIGNVWINPYGGGSRSLIVNASFEVEAIPAQVPEPDSGAQETDPWVSEQDSWVPEPESRQSPWPTIVLVGVAIAGTMRVIAARLAKKTAQAAESGGEEQPEEATVYVLNPSHKMFDIKVNKPVTLTVSGYKVTQEGYQIEKEAVITVSLPPDLAEYFSLQATGSGGQITCTITMLKIPSASQVLLEVDGIFPHGKANTQIPLVFKLDFAISPVYSPNITYNEQENQWQAPDLVASFRDPEQDTPIMVGFYYGFMEPPLTFEPDILEVTEGYTTDDGLTYNFKLSVKDGVDLETYFGQDLTDDNGKVTVNVVVQDEQGKEYPAKTELQVHPQLRMIAYAYDPEKGTGKSGRPKTPEGLELEGMQFVADGIDVLPLVFFFVRTDKEVLEGDEYLSAVDLVDVEKVEFIAGKLPDPEVNTDDSGEGLFAYKVRAHRAILFAKEEPENYTLEVAARMQAGAPQNIGLAGSPLRIEVSPQFLKFHFWVVPGQYRDTSEAFAYVQLYPSKKAVPNMTLSLEVENPPDRDRGFLELVNGDREQTTRETDRYTSNEYIPLPKGSACWALKYSNMSWDNLPSCIFRVTCYGPDSDTGPIWQASRTINVGQNINTLLSDLYGAADQLGLNNPYWKDSLCPYHLRGPIWNILCKFDASKPHVCGWLRNKIREWLDERWFYGEKGDPRQIETLAKMNGIEYQNCAFSPAHVWTNLFLSGTHHIEAAKALDPWWEQRWDDPSLKDHANLITVYSELSWRLAERGLGLRAIAELTAGVLFFAGILVAISMIVPFVSPLTVPSAVAVIKTALKITLVPSLIALYGGTVDYDNYLPDGRKRLYLPEWFMDFIQDVSNSSD